jgi:glycosyltransferase involved in cell wall biosynthesis
VVKKTIVYDLIRTFVAPALTATPRGIDRIDFLLARHFSRDERFDFVGVLPTPWGMRLYDADRVQRGLERLEELWSETTGAADDVGYKQVVDALAGGPVKAQARPTDRLTGFRRGQRMASLLSATGFAFGRSAVKSVPKDSAYVSIGHHSLAMPIFMAWLDRRHDVKPILMLHDVIPLEAPEFVSPSGVRSHATMVKSVAHHAAGLIVTTAHARETILAALAAVGRSEIKTLSVALPLAESFDSPARPEPRLEKIPYFVACGVVDPRKNHLLLLNVWRQLCASEEPAPHLVVIGSVGARGGSILDQMLRCEATRGRIHHVAGLSTAGMKSLIASSLGMLAPSFAEGYGLPIVEALYLGVPVVASDIPAHREIAGHAAMLLDPIDGPAWRSAITALSARQSRPPNVRSALDTHRERVAFFDSISEFVEAI